jgi:hypothetical protein
MIMNPRVDSYRHGRYSGVMTKRAIRGGAEQTVFTGWRKRYCWTDHAGATSWVKRRARRRERREGKQETRETER